MNSTTFEPNGLGLYVVGLDVTEEVIERDGPENLHRR
jgi:hypothetical protein